MNHVERGIGRSHTNTTTSEVNPPKATVEKRQPFRLDSIDDLLVHTPRTAGIRGAFKDDDSDHPRSPKPEEVKVIGTSGTVFVAPKRA